MAPPVALEIQESEYLMFFAVSVHQWWELSDTSSLDMTGNRRAMMLKMLRKARKTQGIGCRWLPWVFGGKDLHRVKK